MTRAAKFGSGDVREQVYAAGMRRASLHGRIHGVLPKDVTTYERPRKLAEIQTNYQKNIKTESQTG